MICTHFLIDVRLLFVTPIQSDDAAKHRSFPLFVCHLLSCYVQPVGFFGYYSICFERKAFILGCIWNISWPSTSSAAARTSSERVSLCILYSIERKRGRASISFTLFFVFFFLFGSLLLNYVEAESKTFELAF